jgi:hypothetical protein
VVAPEGPAGTSWLVLYARFGARCCEGRRVVAPPGAAIAHVDVATAQIVLAWPDGRFAGGETTVGLVAYDARTGQVGGTASRLLSRTPCRPIAARVAAIERTARPGGDATGDGGARYDLVTLDLGAPLPDLGRAVAAAGIDDPQRVAASLRWRADCGAIAFTARAGATPTSVTLRGPQEEVIEGREIPLVADGVVSELRALSDRPLTRLRIETAQLYPKEVADRLPDLRDVVFDLTEEELDALDVRRFEAGSLVQVLMAAPASLDPARFVLKRLTVR